MERCDRQAALGVEVVPDVNWMLTTSSFESVWDVSGLEEGLLRRSMKGV
jgi:hypothetical protein